ncbi:MAG: DUF4230 domain-containing protein [Roseiflexaceae bacterium]|jgi:hypothetical protein|nr:DUF4230 domain-containing protein [Chloroflexaceae bacterium]
MNRLLSWVLLIGPWLLIVVLLSNMQERQLPSWMAWASGVVRMQPDETLVCSETQAPIKVIEKETVVRQIRDMNDWLAKEATITTSVSPSNPEQEVWWKAPFVGQTVTVHMSAKVMAGVVMDDISANGVEISADGTRVTIILPDTQLYAPQIDENYTYASVDSAGIFVSNKDMSLTEQGRAEAVQKITIKACEIGLLQDAADQTRVNVSKFVKAMNPNIQTVDVQVNAGVCPVTQ